MIEDVEKKIIQQHMIEEGDIILAAVSGGADSVCLLQLLCDLQKKRDFVLHVIHVEHGIRGNESVEDALFVEELCRKLQVSFVRYDVEVPSFAREKGMGEEEAARLLRYNCFETEAKKFLTDGKKVKIALAHHADDNAETILFQMVRGSGIDGLCGMQPVRCLSEGIFLIRPLLDMKRSEIEHFLAKRNQDYRTDATNLNTEYSRNKIRHEILPLLTEVNAQAISHINQSAEILREMALYMETQTKNAFEECCVKKKSGILVLAKLWSEYPVVLRREVLHLALEEVAGSRKNLTAAHLYQISALNEKQVGKELSLPYQVIAKRQYDGVFLEKEEKRTKEMFDTGVILTEDTQDISFVLTEEILGKAHRKGGTTIEFEHQKWELKVLDFHGNIEEISQKPYTKWLDYDKIRNRLQIRKRRQGDYLTVDDEGHTKKLKQYFVNEKIPQEARGTIWLLAEESHILWIVGGRISAYYKVSKDTKKVLEVRFVEE